MPQLTEEPAQSGGFPIPEGLQMILEKHLPMPAEDATENQDSGEIDLDKLSPERKTEPLAAPPVPANGEKPPVPPQPAEKDPMSSRLVPEILIEKPSEKVESQIEEMPEEAPASFKSEKSRTDYQKWRKSHQALKEQVRELQARPSAMETDPGLPELVEKQKEQIRQLSDRVKQVDLAASQEFQDNFVLPRNKVYAEAYSLLKDNGGNPETFERAMALTGKARIALLDEIVEEIPSQMQRDRFGRLVEAIDSKNKEIDDALRNAHGKLQEQAYAKETARRAEILQMEKELKTGLEMTQRDLVDNLKLELLTKTGQKEYEWWDKQVDDIKNLSEEIMLRSTKDKLPLVAIFAASFGPQREMWKMERAARLAAEKELSAIKDVEPAIGGGRRQSKNNVADGLDYKAAILARLRTGEGGGETT